MDPVQELLKTGFAITDAGAELMRASEFVRVRAMEFFRSAEPEKQRFATSAGEGFRAYATEYTDAPQQTDLVECFSCSLTRQSVRRRFPNGPGLALYDAMLEAQRTFADVAEQLGRDVLHALGLHPPPILDFAHWSRLQVNYADMARPDRDLLHVVHEDGDFMTLTFSTGPGLQVLKLDRTLRNLWPDAAGKVVVLPGEILSIVSGGRIGAAFHCVERRTDIADRLAILYFADADPERLARCANLNASEIRERITAGWLRSGVAPVQITSAFHCDDEVVD